MKKILLSVLASASFVFTFGQGMQLGTALVDSFNVAEDPAVGIYFFAAEGAEEIYTSITRTTMGLEVVCNEAGKISYDTVIVEGDTTYEAIEGSGYEVFGFSFGDDNGAEPGGNPNWIDLSLNADIAFEIENVSDQAAYITVILQDIDNNQSKYYPFADDAVMDWGFDGDETSSHATGADRITKIGVQIPAGGTVSDVWDLSSVAGKVGGLGDSKTLPVWACGSPAACPNTEYQLDASKVTTVLFFVNAGEQLYADEETTPYTGTIKFKYLAMGDIANGTLVGLSNTVAKKGLLTYPNPASSQVKFGTELTNVTVYDAIGNVVTKKAKASDLNVADFKSGIYFLNSSEGTTQFIVE